jgi:hypothetical protein
MYILSSLDNGLKVTFPGLLSYSDVVLQDLKVVAEASPV